MENSKKYYWLKLKEDFFEEDTMRFLREQPNGSEYCVFYLILCLKSLRTDGRLARVIGDTIVPYDVKALANLTGVLEDTVKGALSLLLKYGVIKQMESGELYLQQVEEMVGSETKWAELKRKRRAKALEGMVEKDALEATNVVKKPTVEIASEIGTVVKNTSKVEKLTGENSSNWKMSKKCPREIEIEIEKEKEKDIKKEKKESFDDILADKVADEELRERFVEFIKMRKMIKAPLTNYALKLAINKVEKLSNGDLEKAKRIVEQSIERSWKGFFDVPDEKKAPEKDGLYEPKDGEDVTYQRMFEKWKQYLGVGLKQTESQVKACNELLEDLGEDGLERLIVALRMRSEHGFLTRELKSVKDFVTLNDNKMVVQNFYNEHWRMWQMQQEANQQGKKIWEL